MGAFLFSRLALLPVCIILLPNLISGTNGGGLIRRLIQISIVLLLTITPVTCQGYICTAYTGGGITASGVEVSVGMAACNWLPLGTHVIINGNEYIITDRLGTNSVDFDIYMATEEECIQFGIQDLPVTVL